MTQDEIIRMAREAGFIFPETQEDSFTCWWEELERFAALVAAHEREKQAEQEPVGWAHPSGECLSARYMKGFATGLEKETYTIPLYTHPVRTKDLTDDEIELVVANLGFAQLSPIEVARAVIAADREKNK